MGRSKSSSANIYAPTIADGISVGGCSPGQSDLPTEAAARAYYEGEFKELVAPGTLKIASFMKTNRVKRGDGDETNCELEYEADLEFPKGWLPECVDTTHFNLACQMARTQRAKPQPVGAKKHDTGKVYFEKTEMGWRPKGLQAKWLDPFGG